MRPSTRRHRIQQEDEQHKLKLYNKKKEEIQQLKNYLDDNENSPEGIIVKKWIDVNSKEHPKSLSHIKNKYYNILMNYYILLNNTNAVIEIQNTINNKIQKSNRV